MIEKLCKLLYNKAQDFYISGPYQNLGDGSPLKAVIKLNIKEKKEDKT